MAQIDFYALAGASEYNTVIGGSGIGFYGDSGFGTSVAVGAWNGSTYVTDGNGVINGSVITNTKFMDNTSYPGASSQSGLVGGSTRLNVRGIPNSQATLNMRFTHSSAVQCQNVRVRIYDRANIDAGPTGVDCRFAEIIHPAPWSTQGTTTAQLQWGSGYYTFIQPWGSALIAPMANSPGISGLKGPGSGSVVTDTRHDWYCVMSASPTTIGSKTQFGLYMSLEYL